LGNDKELGAGHRDQHYFAGVSEHYILGGLFGNNFYFKQASYRTGRADEGAVYLEKIIELMPNTPYEPVAKKWKSNPETAAKGTITCMTCHDAGRLAPRMAELSK
jgi:hypothetical protein